MVSANHSSTNLFAIHQFLLRERLQHFLNDLHPLLYADVRRALEESGKLLSHPPQEGQGIRSTPPAGTWSLLTLLVAQHISPEIEPLLTSSVALAVEFFICALDLLDDIEDEDQTPIVRTLGPARVLNVSTTLLALAQQAILSLTQLGANSELITRLLSALQEVALTATSGQHRDILAEQRSAQDFTYEECIEIASQKAGSLMRLACWLGTLCAGADDALCQQFSQLGHLLGIAHQLDNDCHDLYYLLHGRESATLSTNAGLITKTDLTRGKKTLPVVLAAQAGFLPQELSQIGTQEGRDAYVQALDEGILTAWGICLLYRERARECLQKIEAQHPISPTLRLLLGIE